MRSSRIAIAAALLIVCAGTVHASIVLNEAYVNPPGSDDNREFVELLSTTGGVESLAGLTLVQIEANGGNKGRVLDSYDLGSLFTGANGLLILGNGYDDNDPVIPWTIPAGTAKADPGGFGSGELDNGSITLLLVGGYAGNDDDDLDTDDDGVLDATPWSAIVDGIGWLAGGDGFVYDSAADLSDADFTPDAAARLPGEVTPNSLLAWYFGEIAGADVSTAFEEDSRGANFPAGGQLTPGAPNVPEPGTLVILTAGGLSVFRRRRMR